MILIFLILIKAAFVSTMRFISRWQIFLLLFWVLALTPVLPGQTPAKTQPAWGIAELSVVDATATVRMPEPIERALQDSLGLSLRGPVFTVRMDFNSIQATTPHQGFSIHAPATPNGSDAANFKWRLCPLLVGGDANSYYASVALHAERLDTGQAALFTVQIAANRIEGQWKGTSTCSGPFVGKWERFSGTRLQPVTSWLLPIIP